MFIFIKIMNQAHSEIHDYPIDYKLFPLAKECEELTIVVNEGEYLIIPYGWHHWVFTDPKTLSISYTITNIEFNNIDNVFYDSLVNNIPYVGKMKNRINITYESFYNSALGKRCCCIFSETNQCCPVYKTYKHNTFECNGILNNIVNITNHHNFYTYIGMEPIREDSILHEYNKIETFIDEPIYDKIEYEAFLWFTLDKEVDSGLHYDSTSNIIYVIEGKKTVRLFHPDQRKNLYIKDHEKINTHYIDGSIK